MGFILILLGIILAFTDFRFLFINIDFKPIGYFILLLGLIKVYHMHKYFKFAKFISTFLVIITLPNFYINNFNPQLNSYNNEILFQAIFYISIIFNLILGYLIYYGFYELAHKEKEVYLMNFAESGFIVSIIFILYQFFILIYPILIIPYYLFILIYLFMISKVFVKFLIVSKK